MQITLKDILDAVEYRISGGSDFLWQCFGTNARFLGFANPSGEEYGDIVFDTKTQEVYNIVAYPTDTAHGVEWINPKFKEAYFNEAETKNVTDIERLKLLSASEILQVLRDVSANN
jgi:hypothetical protein